MAKNVNVSPTVAHPTARALTIQGTNTPQGHAQNKATMQILVKNANTPGFTGTPLHAIVPRGTVKTV